MLAITATRYLKPRLATVVKICQTVWQHGTGYWTTGMSAEIVSFERCESTIRASSRRITPAGAGIAMDTKTAAGRISPATLSLPLTTQSGFSEGEERGYLSCKRDACEFRSDLMVHAPVNILHNSSLRVYVLKTLTKPKIYLQHSAAIRPTSVCHVLPTKQGS